MRRCRWCALPLEEGAPEQRIYHAERCAKEAAVHASTMHAKEKAAERGQQEREAEKRRRINAVAVPQLGPVSSKAVGEPIWTCSKCGLVPGALFGTDERFHCSSLDCDLVVRVLTDEEAKTSVVKSEWKSDSDRSDEEREARRRAWAESRNKAAESAQASARESARESAQASKQGKEILATMKARNETRRSSVAKKKTKKAKQGGDGGSKSRRGKCETCKEIKWLLRKDPLTCAGCYRAENPPDHSKDAAKKRGTPKPQTPKAVAEDLQKSPAKALALLQGSPEKSFAAGEIAEAIGVDSDRKTVGGIRAALARGLLKKVGRGQYQATAGSKKVAPAESESEKQKPKRQYRRRKKSTVVDDLAHECRAIEECSRVLEGLSPQAIERVIAYTLHRYSQTNGLPVKPSPVLAFLPEPDISA